MARELGDYRDIHATWGRHDFAWNVIKPKPDRFDWGGYDRLVGAARSRGIKMIAALTYTPAWANGGHSDPRYAPTSASQFGTLPGGAARYGSRGVHTYEIWNEPNIQYWQPKPNPADYAQVLCAAYQGIHRADPQAIVLAGGTSPAADTATTYAPQTWLSDLYGDGARRCFDDVAYHPYIDSIAAHGNLGGNWYLMDSAVVPHSLRSIMVSHGDGAKRIWATEVAATATASATRSAPTGSVRRSRSGARTVGPERSVGPPTTAPTPTASSIRTGTGDRSGTRISARPPRVERGGQRAMIRRERRNMGDPHRQRSTLVLVAESESVRSSVRWHEAAPPNVAATGLYEAGDTAMRGRSPVGSTCEPPARPSARVAPVRLRALGGRR